MPKSLFLRLMGAFALVIVVGYAIVYVIANQTTASEFQFYMFRGQMVATQNVTNQLADYYRARGSWSGVEAILTRDAAPSGGMMGAPRWWVADARGTIVAASDGSRVGQQLAPSEIANGAPIRMGSQTVGTLLADMGMMAFAPHAGTGMGGMSMPDPSAQEFLNQVNRSLLLAGTIAVLVALVLGFVLFRQITAPLNALTIASEKISAGDMNARVTVRGEDEIAQVGHAFNAMVENLARSETARRNMLADVAHELRNPLGVIQSHLEAMLDGVFPLSAEQIASLHDETLLLTRLVDDLRELALADAGQLSFHYEATDPSALVARTTDAFQAQAAESRIALACDIAADIPRLNIDAQRIEQVLRNLISNALRYTPVGGSVSVKLNRDGNAVRIAVSDTGPGIPPEALAHVFERFWRGDKSRARVRGGAGLGLAIARQWVQAHGGQIGVESTSGHGATFWFTLPLERIAATQ